MTDTAPTEDDAPVEIHKPKAAHSLREFLIEIGTIICGILIALGLEQTVEAIHRHNEVREARKALNAEIAFDLGSSEVYISQIGCIDKRLDELERWIASFETPNPMRIERELQYPTWMIFRRSAWSTASMGAVEKMPVELRMTYGAMYDSLNFQDRFLFMMRDNWVDLRKRLNSKTLSERDRQDLLGDVQQIREINTYFADNHRALVLKWARELGVKPDASETLASVRARAEAVCRPLLPSITVGR